MFEKNFCLVAIDDTANWTPELSEKCGGKIFTLYVFDSEDISYCNSESPNLRLLPVRSVPAVATADTETLKELDEGFSECEEIYIHFLEIPKIPQDMKMEKELEEDTTLEEAVEYFFDKNIVPAYLQPEI